MAKKEETKEEDVYPLYVQSSNPTPELLAWVSEERKKGIVYLQSGHPPDPPIKPPGGG